jgi:hypothetical protein
MSKHGRSVICLDCEKAEGISYYPVYRLTCNGCAQRLVMNEQCKIQRSLMAEYLQMRYDIATNWKQEPSCGCNDVCERRKNVKSNKDIL